MEIHNKIISIPLIIIGIVLLVVFSAIKINLDKQAIFLCEAVENNPDLTMEQCPAHQQSNSWYLFLGFGAVIATIGAGLFMMFFSGISLGENNLGEVNPENMMMSGKNSLHKKKQREFGEKEFSEEEKQVLDHLEENEGSAYQSDLVKTLGWSKVKTTRVLDKLENKKILERKRRGMTNLVVLK